MIQVKAGLTYFVPVRLLTSLGAPVTGVAYTSVVATLWYSNNTSVVPTLTPSNWVEYGQGAYGMQITVAAIPGPLTNIVVVAGANAFVGVYDVVTNVAADAVVAATASSTASAAAQALCQIAVNVLTGNQSINSSTNVLYLFAPGVPIGTTGYIARFNLTDNTGAPTSTNIYTRVSF